MTPGAYSILLLEYGCIERYPASNLFAAEPFEGFRPMPFCFGLVRSADRCLLVDTGFWDEDRHRALGAKYGAARWCPPAEVVRRAGVDPSDVDTVVLTHNHFDHAGCVRDFPNAHVYLQREELERAAVEAALPPRFGFLTRAAQSDLAETLAQRDRVTLVEAEVEIAAGIHLVPALDTHTPGSQYVVVDNEADGRWVFPGDLVYVYENVEGLRDDGVLAPIGMSTGSVGAWLTAAAELLDRVGGDTRRILPFHDPVVWTRHPAREYEDRLHVGEVSLAGGGYSVRAAPTMP